MSATRGLQDRMKNYYVYILANASRSLYVGVTAHLMRRVWEHKQRRVQGFTRKYKLTELVYYEIWGDVRSAIAREKEIKGWRRLKKTRLVESANPRWKDLSADWSASTPLRQE